MGWEIDLALLVLRLFVGIGFVFHSNLKLLGESRKKAVEFMKSVGVPGALTTLVALNELIGGLFLIFGVLTRLAAGLLALEMVGTALLSRYRLKSKYIGGYEVDLTFLAVNIALVLLGAGKFSIDDLLGLRKLPLVA